MGDHQTRECHSSDLKCANCTGKHQAGDSLQFKWKRSINIGSAWIVTMHCNLPCAPHQSLIRANLPPSKVPKMPSNKFKTFESSCSLFSGVQPWKELRLSFCTGIVCIYQQSFDIDILSFNIFFLHPTINSSPPSLVDVPPPTKSLPSGGCSRPSHHYQITHTFSLRLLPLSISTVSTRQNIE